MGLGWVWVWDLCAGLLYEHRFAMLIKGNVDAADAANFLIIGIANAANAANLSIIGIANAADAANLSIIGIAANAANAANVANVAATANNCDGDEEQSLPLKKSMKKKLKLTLF